MSTATSETVDTQAEAAVEEEEKKQGTFARLWFQHYDLVILPVIVLLLLLFLFFYIGTRDLDTIELRVLAFDNVAGPARPAPLPRADLHGPRAGHRRPGRHPAQPAGPRDGSRGRCSPSAASARPCRPSACCC